MGTASALGTKDGRFTSGDNASPGKKIFNVTVTWIKSGVEPDGIRDGVMRESVAVVIIHPTTLTILAR